MIWPGSPGTIALCWQAAGRAGSPCLASLLGCSQALPQHLQALWGVEDGAVGWKQPQPCPNPHIWHWSLVQCSQGAARALRTTGLPVVEPGAGARGAGPLWCWDITWAGGAVRAEGCLPIRGLHVSEHGATCLHGAACPSATAPFLLEAPGASGSSG